MKISVFGNRLVDEDSIAVSVGEALERRGYSVEYIENPFTLLTLLQDITGNEQTEKNESGEVIDKDKMLDMVILDVANGIEKVRKLSIDEINSNRCCSVHGLDLSCVLKLLYSLCPERLRRVIIIGIPYNLSMGMNTEGVADAVLSELRKIE